MVVVSYRFQSIVDYLTTNASNFRRSPHVSGSVRKRRFEPCFPPDDWAETIPKRLPPPTGMCALALFGVTRPWEIRATAVLVRVLSSSHWRVWIPTDVIQRFQLSIIVFSDPRKRCIPWDMREKWERFYEDIRIRVDEVLRLYVHKKAQSWSSVKIGTCFESSSILIDRRRTQSNYHLVIAALSSPSKSTANARAIRSLITNSRTR